MSNMDGYKSPIITAVAYPPTLFFVPMELAGLNFGVCITLMLIAVGFFHMSPPPWIILIITTHILLAVKSSRDPHYASLARCIGKMSGPRPNYSSEPDVRTKYVP